MPKTILIICRAHLEKAPRFLIQVEALHNDYTILATGLSGDANASAYKFIPLIPSEKKGINITFHHKYPVLLRKIVSAVLRLFYSRSLDSEKENVAANFKLLKSNVYNLVIAHHLDDLPLGIKLAKHRNVKLIFNAHEYYPLQFSDKEEWMKNSHPYMMEKATKYLKHVDACFCVGEKIAEKYKEEFGLNSIVITNAKPFYDIAPQVLKNDSIIKLVHHGVANKSRKLELMIDMMSHLGDGYSLDLILVPGEPLYIKELKELASRYPNIHFPEAVETVEISRFINKYDIGIYILPPVNFNNIYALPNKFFEFIQARLAIAIAPSVEMKYLVEKYDLGVVADDFTSKVLADKIKLLDCDKIMFFKNAAHLNAKKLSADENMQKIANEVHNLINFE